MSISNDLFSFYEKEENKEDEKPETRGRKPLTEAYDMEVLAAINELELDKQYYPIGEVADMFHVKTSLIRYWDNEFPILKPRKTRKGDRLFRPEDIRHLQLIYHLLRERKFTIEGAKKKLKDDKPLTEENFEMVQSLQKVKRFLLELKSRL